MFQGRNPSNVSFVAIVTVAGLLLAMSSSFAQSTNDPESQPKANQPKANQSKAKSGSTEPSTKPATDQKLPVLDTGLQPLPSDQDLLPKEAQSKLVRAIYDATKKIRSGNDCTDLIRQCERTINMSVSDKNRAYVVSIKGWALNRRGEFHLNQARQYKSLGSVERYQATFKTAMKDFDLSLLNDSKRHRTWNARGIAHVVNQDYPKAISDFTEATRRKPDFTAAWFNRAEAWYQHDQPKAAIKDYQTVLRFESKDAEALTGRGICYLAMGEFKNAIDDFKTVQSMFPNRPSAYVNLGDTFLAWGKWQESQTAYQKGVEVGESVAENASELRVAKQRLAWLMATCPNQKIAAPTEALEMIRGVILEDGETIKRLETLAAAEAASGNFESATVNQKNAIRLVNFASESVESQTNTRLTLYEQRKPYQLSPTSSDSIESTQDSSRQDAKRE